MRPIHFIIFLLSFTIFTAQEFDRPRFNQEICEEVVQKQLNPDVAEVFVLSKLSDFYNSQAKPFNEKEYRQWFLEIIENCSYIVIESSKLFNDRNNTNTIVSSTLPKKELSNKKCSKILNNFSAFYRDIDGKITDIKIFNKTYYETFADGSFSQLEFIDHKDCSYKLKYVKSTHPLKKEINKIFDVYLIDYYLINENDTYYTVAMSGFYNKNSFTQYQFYKRMEDVPVLKIKPEN